MKRFSILILSIALTLLSSLVQAERMPPSSIEPKANESIAAMSQSESDKETEYFKQVLTDGGLYALILALDYEVPEVSRAGKFVSVFKQLSVANSLLSQIVTELKTTNALLKQSMLHKGVAMDG